MVPRVVLLYASPLTQTIKTGNNDDETIEDVVEIQTLDVASESSRLLTTFQEANRKVRMNVAVATAENLLDSLGCNTSIIHYAGHGLPDGLGFEDGQGSLQKLSTQDLRNILEHPSLNKNPNETIASVKLAFVSACHSQGAGEVLVEAGVPHVVAVRWDAQVTDLASRRFAHSFYLALAVGHTVQEAFDKGQAAVETTPGISEVSLARQGKKFLLLPENGDHDVRILSDLEVGPPVNETPPLPVSYCDGVPHPFIGRQVEVQRVVKKISQLKQLGQRKWISVLGPKHSGRRSFVSSVCAYFSTRRLVDAVYSIRVGEPLMGNSEPTPNQVKMVLLSAVRESVFGNDPVAAVRSLEELTFKLSCGKQRIMVIQLSAECEPSWYVQMRVALQQLTSQAESLQLIVITDAAMGGDLEEVVRLQPLKPLRAAQLFLEIVSPGVMAGSGLLHSIFPAFVGRDPITLAQMETALSTHPFLEQLGGLPPLVVAVASSVRDRRIATESRLAEVVRSEQEHFRSSQSRTATRLSRTNCSTGPGPVGTKNSAAPPGAPSVAVRMKHHQSAPAAVVPRRSQVSVPWSAMWERSTGSVDGKVSWATLVPNLQQEFCRELYMAPVGPSAGWVYPPQGIETRVLSYQDLDTLRRKLEGKELLGDNGTASVSAHDLSRFWDWFSCVMNTLRQEVVSWSVQLQSEGFHRVRVIHGFLSKEEAGRMLSGHEVGTFLIRISENNPGCLALTMVVADGRTGHSLVRPSQGGGFNVTLASGTESFKNLAGVLKGCTFLTKLFPGIPKEEVVHIIQSVHE